MTLFGSDYFGSTFLGSPYWRAAAVVPQISTPTGGGGSGFHGDPHIVRPQWLTNDGRPHRLDFSRLAVGLESATGYAKLKNRTFVEPKTGAVFILHAKPQQVEFVMHARPETERIILEREVVVYLDHDAASQIALLREENTARWLSILKWTLTCAATLTAAVLLFWYANEEENVDS